MDDNSNRWPKKGNKLFKKHMGLLPREADKWNSFVEGYQRAAAILVEYYKKSIPSEHQFLYYPIIFLYRHYIEIQLKKIILDCNRILNKSLKLPKTHDIIILWNSCKNLYSKIDHEIDNEINAHDLQIIEDCIIDFSRFDPTATTFRYPKDKNDKPIPLAPNIIDLNNFFEIIDRITGFLESISKTLDYELDEDKEALADFLNDIFGREFY